MMANLGGCGLTGRDFALNVEYADYYNIAHERGKQAETGRGIAVPIKGRSQEAAGVVWPRVVLCRDSRLPRLVCIHVVRQDHVHRVRHRDRVVPGSGGGAVGHSTDQARLEAWRCVGDLPGGSVGHRDRAHGAIRQHVRAADDLHGQGTARSIQPVRRLRGRENPFQAARDERSWRRDHEEHQGIVGHRFRRSGGEHHDGGAWADTESDDSAHGGPWCRIRFPGSCSRVPSSPRSMRPACRCS